MYCVYKITSPTGRSYIGTTKNLNARIADHLRIRNGCCKQHIQRVLRRYGIHRCRIEIIAQGEMDRTTALEYESLAIHAENCVYPNGYNHLGGKFHKPSRIATRNFARGQTGRKHSAESIAKRSQAFRGREITSEWRAKISRSLREYHANAR